MAGRVPELIARECGVPYHPRYVGRILARLGWSCQRPVGRAFKPDEAAVGSENGCVIRQSSLDRSGPWLANYRFRNCVYVHLIEIFLVLKTIFLYIVALLLYRVVNLW